MHGGLHAITALANLASTVSYDLKMFVELAFRRRYKKLEMLQQLCSPLRGGRHDIQHNDIQHNDIHHNDI
jgi:hypothetical protein